MKVPAQKQVKEKETGRIDLFPARGSRAKAEAGRKEPDKPDLDQAAVADLKQYERGAEPDDYSRRMIINVAAFTFIVALALAGIWLADQLALLRKHQDCALSGRKNCTEIDWHAPDR
jgi:hypothetical protein